MLTLTFDLIFGMNLIWYIALYHTKCCVFLSLWVYISGWVLYIVWVALTHWVAIMMMVELFCATRSMKEKQGFTFRDAFQSLELLQQSMLHFEGQRWLINSHPCSAIMMLYQFRATVLTPWLDKVKIKTKFSCLAYCYEKSFWWS